MQRKKMLRITLEKGIFRHYYCDEIRLKRPYMYPFAPLSESHLLISIPTFRIYIWFFEIALLTLIVISVLFALSIFSVNVLIFQILAFFVNVVVIVYGSTKILAKIMLIIVGRPTVGHVVSITQHSSAGDDFLEQYELLSEDGLIHQLRGASISSYSIGDKIRYISAGRKIPLAISNRVIVLTEAALCVAFYLLTLKIISGNFSVDWSSYW